MLESNTKFNVDLRSDTVTQPTPEMLDAMFHAQVGDDVFGEDPTVIALEEKVAKLFGKEKGLFCPSGTMTNQIALNILSSPGDELICDSTSHVYLYEVGGLAFNSGLSTNLLVGTRGQLNADQIENSLRSEDIHRPNASVVSLENTHNRGGGSIYKIEEVRKIKSLCDSKNLKLHLDGARIFNALTEADYTAEEIGKNFDTISVSISKGLGAPVGSVLVANSELIHKARRKRKMFGGGMRQSGYLAAAGIYALDNHLPLLKKDHHRAQHLAETMNGLSFTQEVFPVETNIVITKLDNKMPLESFLKELLSKGIKAIAFGPQSVRMVTHLNFTDEMLEYTQNELKKI